VPVGAQRVRQHIRIEPVVLVPRRSVPGPQPLDLPARHHEHRQSSRQQLLDDRAVPALDRHPGHASSMQPPDHGPDRGGVVSEAEPGSHHAVPIQQTGGMDL